MLLELTNRLDLGSVVETRIAGVFFLPWKNDARNTNLFAFNFVTALLFLVILDLELTARLAFRTGRTTITATIARCSIGSRRPRDEYHNDQYREASISNHR